MYHNGITSDNHVVPNVYISKDTGSGTDYYMISNRRCISRAYAV